MRIAAAFSEDSSLSRRRAEVIHQDLAFQAAVRRELGIMAAERGLRLAPKTPRPRDIIKVMAEPEPVEAPAPFPHTILPQAHWRVIVREVCEKHDVLLVDLMSIRRPVKVVRARHEAMYRMRHETNLTLPQIGQRLGGRDHTTVLHGVRKHEAGLAGRKYQPKKSGRSANAYEEAMRK